VRRGVGQRGKGPWQRAAHLRTSPCGQERKSKAARVDDLLPIFAANLRRIREQRGLSQEALALRCDMDPADVRRIETSNGRQG
jgi:ribosome-binding protein aMBF1 (putative translation factor)